MENSLKMKDAMPVDIVGRIGMIISRLTIGYLWLFMVYPVVVETAAAIRVPRRLCRKHKFEGAHHRAV